MATLETMARSLTAVAIIAAHNEADIIAPVVGHLIDQGLSVYLLDHGSTDGTAQAVERFLGRGLLAIEAFPGDRFPAARSAFAWADILTRKAELAAALDADWFIHHDADEFRESPWDHVRLLEAIERVDRLGYNAIDFALYNFWPTGDDFRAGDDPRPSFRFCEPGRAWDKLQVKCWKKAREVDLVTSGGHDVALEGRRVFPVRFLLRHYPVRSQLHGARKVFVERRPRLLAQEVARGWHLQYADCVEGQTFVREPGTLVEYDGEAARLALVLGNREAEERQATLDATRAGLDETRVTLGAAIAQLSKDLHDRQGEVQAYLAELAIQQALIDRLLADIETQRREIAALHASRSWRWTAPLRAVQRRILGR